jgi:predicted AAA+ superfamily ATPase
MYQPREIEGFIGRASGLFPVLLVTGARQVGKTTLLRRLSGPERGYVTLDDPLALGLAREDPALFMQRFPPPVLIDEIQYAPGLLPYIKMAVDDRRMPGGFWLTGSQQFHLMRGVSESLAGRVAVVRLAGLSRREAAGLVSSSGEANPPFLPLPEEIDRRLRSGGALPLPDLFRGIWRGSLPAMALDPDMDHEVFYGSYVQTYLQRDVRDLARVGDEAAFVRFLRAAAARTGQMLNLAELARDTDVAPNTAKAWLSILLASGLVHLLEPYHANLTKRLVKTPKLYFLDTGLAAYLAGWRSPETLESGAMSGAVLETWILGELLKGYWSHGREAPFFYYRDRDRREVDLLIVQDGRIHPLEFKKSASPDRRDVRHFAALESLGMPLGPGGLVCLATQSLPLGQEARSIPVAAL